MTQRLSQAVIDLLQAIDLPRQTRRTRQNLRERAEELHQEHLTINHNVQTNPVLNADGQIRQNLDATRNSIETARHNLQ
uniref:Uncharacterized protein n=1 Tax=Meloidogyne enterolobii TaxID=390850 RepID=A0A6V7XA37_MELEN|nr:unnamed protein product [Meloidogyne enterolobii]